MRRNPFLAAALDSADRGFWVFPLRPDSKIPAISDWENRATTNKLQIYAWWANNSRKNIGIAAGRSRLLVVDLDTARGTTAPPRWAGAHGGGDVLRLLADDVGQPYPGDTLTVTTPSGGRHLYFRMPAGTGLRNTAGRLGWKIDTRGYGGFVVAAGSIRRDGRYRITRHREIAPPVRHGPASPGRRAGTGRTATTRAHAARSGRGRGHDDWRRVVHRNVLGLMYIPTPRSRVLERRGDRADVVDRRAHRSPPVAAYAATKFAVNAFSESLRSARPGFDESVDLSPPPCSTP